VRALARDPVYLTAARGSADETKPAAPRAGDHPFAPPYYWAAFALIGDPGYPCFFDTW